MLRHSIIYANPSHNFHLQKHCLCGWGFAPHMHSRPIWRKSLSPGRFTTPFGTFQQRLPIPPPHKRRLFRLPRLVFIVSTSAEVSRYSGATRGSRTLVPGLEDQCTTVVRLRHIYREWPAPGIVSFHCQPRGLWGNVYRHKHFL